MISYIIISVFIKDGTKFQKYIVIIKTILINSGQEIISFGITVSFNPKVLTAHGLP